MKSSVSIFQLLMFGLLFADQIWGQTTTTVQTTTVKKISASNQTTAAYNHTTAVNQTSEASCPPGSNYTCNATCVKYCDEISEVNINCTQTCGCACPTDQVFQSNTSLQCVPISSCEEKCPANMHFEECAPDTPKVCGKTEQPPDTGCNPKCVCDDEHILSSYEPRVCVPEGMCFGRAD